MVLQTLNFKEYAYSSDTTKILKEMQDIGAELIDINIKPIKDEAGNLIFDYTIKFKHMKKVTRLFNKYYPVFFTLLLEDFKEW